MRELGVSEAAARRLVAHVEEGILSQREVKLFVKAFRNLVPEEWLRPAGKALGSGAIEDLVRFALLADRCRKTREKRGLDVKQAAAGCCLPQYRIRAIERSRVKAIDPSALGTYVDFLGLRRFLARWTRANAKLAARLGIRSRGRV